MFGLTTGNGKSVYMVSLYIRDCFKLITLTSVSVFWFEEEMLHHLFSVVREIAVTCVKA